jgi:hypothetical protein
VGKGRVIWGSTPWEVFAAEGLGPDFTWRGGDDQTLVDFIHRRTDDTHFYFIVNRNDRPENLELSFRLAGFVPELWDPVDGSRRDATTFRNENGRTILPLAMDGEQSCFVLFRKPLPTSESARAGAPNRPLLAPLVAIEGPWELRFDPRLGGPAQPVTWPRLEDWSKHADPAIRFYSGAAVYTKAFAVAAEQLAKTGRRFLDLGELDSLCEVTLNGRHLGVLWSHPFRVDVSDTLRAGHNELQVKVVNVWDNRLIGDAALPAARRITRTNITNLTPKSPLARSGLLGPVRLLAAPDAN